MKNPLLLLLLLCFLLSKPAISQDLDSLLLELMGEQEQAEVVNYTFKATRIISGHSIERMQHRDMDFRVHHRFGRINSGINDFYGLDKSNSFLGLEYGITDFVMAGIGRSTYQKTVNAFLKFSLFRQKTGNKAFPFSISILTASYANTLPLLDSSRINYFTSRLSYAHQILIARKINEKLSLQLSPGMVHRNLVQAANDPNDLFFTSLGGRYKITNRFALTFEGFFIFPSDENSSMKYNNPLSIGVDIETGSHVFQLHLTNSPGMTELHLIGDTEGRWLKGDILIGFNITRVFTLKGKKYEEKMRMGLI